MSDLRRDPVTGRWVIISTERRKRAGVFQLEPVTTSADPSCPFCEGHEAMTPHELLAVRPDGGAANGPGWQVRVVPNQFPVLRVEGLLDRRGEGLYDSMNGIGAHEVIIESPRHEATLATLEPEAVERVLWAIRDRLQDLRQDRRFRSLIAFKNHGRAAGALLDHPHSQIIALPIVPREVRDELDGARAHFENRERCLFCDIVRQDLADGRRVVAESADMVALAPWAPRFPFETWVLPRRHQASYEETPRHEIGALARLLGDLLRRMDQALSRPPWHLLIHTAPLGESVGEWYHWHVEIFPKLTRVAGFEWATGFYVNPTAPEEAAAVLREVVVR